MDTASTVSATEHSAGSRTAWLFSWPLLVGASVYLFALKAGNKLLADGDTY